VDQHKQSGPPQREQAPCFFTEEVDGHNYFGILLFRSIIIWVYSYNLKR